MTNDADGFAGEFIKNRDQETKKDLAVSENREQPSSESAREHSHISNTASTRDSEMSHCLKVL